jgi:hypothetical protein
MISIVSGASDSHVGKGKTKTMHLSIEAASEVRKKKSNLKKRI